MSKLKGGCMCGQIQYDSNVEPMMTAVCHCPDCQKQTGTSFSVVVALPPDALEISGQTTIYVTTGESGAKVHRYFCGICGSPIYSLPDGMPGMIFLKAGTLDDTSWLEPELEIWTDTAQRWCKMEGSWDSVPRNPPMD